MKLNMITLFSITFLLYSFLSKSTANNSPEPSPPYPSPTSEAPNHNPTPEEPFGNYNEESTTTFSAAFSDILKGSLRGPSLTMPHRTFPHNKDQNHHQAVQQICSHTDYPEICVSTIVPFLSHKFDVMNVLEASLKACSHQLKFTITKVERHAGESKEMASALSECKEHYHGAMENVQKALNAIPSRDLGTVTVMLSAVMADVSSCESGFEDMKAKSPPVTNSEGLVTITASNCLAIAALIPY